MFFIKSLGVIGPPLIESFDPRLLRRSLAIPSGHFGHLFQYFIYLGIKPRICLRSKNTLFRPRGLSRILQVPMRPTTGGIFFERNLRTKIISSNEEKF